MKLIMKRSSFFIDQIQRLVNDSLKIHLEVMFLSEVMYQVV